MSNPAWVELINLTFLYLNLDNVTLLNLQKKKNTVLGAYSTDSRVLAPTILQNLFCVKGPQVGSISPCSPFSVVSFVTAERCD